jgi:hypothetical protein
MDIQVATLCDSAMDYNGKLCILGTFDTICSREVPVIHLQCCLALRICFTSGDEGKHRFAISIIDADGNDQLSRPVQAGIEVRFPGDAYFVTRNLILNLHKLQFKQTGQFSIEIAVDEEIFSSIPLRVMQIEKA